MNFKEIIEEASRSITSLSESRQKNLKESLNHGKAILKSNLELNAYLHYYGDMHRKKLLTAFERLPAKLWNNKSISVIDYGCGQGIASMVLIDYLRENELNPEMIKNLILIEPSYESISQSVKHMKLYGMVYRCKFLQKKDSEICLEDLMTESGTVLHLFSNVIDMPDFDSVKIGNLINSLSNKRRNIQRHIIICSSPYYPEEGRGSRIPAFGEGLKGFKRIYSFEKHIDEWDEDFSCQIQIFDNKPDN